MKGAVTHIKPMPAQAFLLGADPACRRDDIDPELFFPHEGGSFEKPLRICGRCPVKAQCADWAVKTGQQFGMFGGLRPDEIRARRRQLREAA